MRKREDAQETRLLRYGKAVLLGGASAFLCCLLFLFLASVGMSKGFIGTNLSYQLTIAACAVGSLVGGLIAARTCQGGGLVVGLVTGLVLFLLQLTVGILAYGELTIENGGLGILLPCLCGGAVAGLLGGREKRGGAKKKKRKNR